jgi:hypothetical protein
MNILSKTREVRKQDFIGAASAGNMKSNFTFLLLTNAGDLQNSNEDLNMSDKEN